MPVRRFRDITEVPQPVSARTASANLRAAFELSNLCAKLARRQVTAGIRRFPSIDGPPAPSA